MGKIQEKIQQKLPNRYDGKRKVNIFIFKFLFVLPVCFNQNLLSDVYVCFLSFLTVLIPLLLFYEVHQSVNIYHRE